MVSTGRPAAKPNPAVTGSGESEKSPIDVPNEGGFSS